MRHLLKITLVTLVLGAAWMVAARAQQSSSSDKKPTEDKKPAEAQMQMPQQGPEMERLKFLLGSWDWKAAYLKSPEMPNGGDDSGWYKAELGPGGFSIIADFEADGPMGKEIGHQILSWDPKQKGYLAVTVGNSFPGALIGSSHWEGDNLVTDGQYDEGGVTMHVRSTYSNITAKSTHMTDAFLAPDGTYHVIWEGEATRK
jgi:hypothetical protein